LKPVHREQKNWIFFSHFRESIIHEHVSSITLQLIRIDRKISGYENNTELSKHGNRFGRLYGKSFASRGDDDPYVVLLSELHCPMARPSCFFGARSLHENETRLLCYYRDTYSEIPYLQDGRVVVAMSSVGRRVQSVSGRQ